MGGTPEVPAPPPQSPAPPPQQPVEEAIFEPTADESSDKEKKLKAIKLGKKRLQVPVSGGTKAGVNRST
jgi:hypothetical protein